MLIAKGKSVQGMLRRSALSNVIVRHLAKSICFLLWNLVISINFCWFLLDIMTFLPSLLLTNFTLHEIIGLWQLLTKLHWTFAGSCAPVCLLTNRLPSQILGQYWKADQLKGIGETGNQIAAWHHCKVQHVACVPGKGWGTSALPMCWGKRERRSAASGRNLLLGRGSPSASSYPGISPHACWEQLTASC